MELQKLEHNFTVCKVDNIEQINFSREFIFLSKTDDEISLVCESDYVPPNATASKTGWKGLRIVGVLDFGLVGILAKIANILAEAGISIFAVSTYNTDYIFIKAIHFDKAIQTLTSNGYTLKH